MIRKNTIVGGVLVLGITAAVFAQGPVNPNTVTFTSVDHNVVENGTPVVSRYIIEVLPQGSTTVAATRDIGKPALTGSEVVYNQLASIRTTLPPGNYVLRVVAEGEGGRAVSPNSDPFTVAQRAPTAPAKPLTRQ